VNPYTPEGYELIAANFSRLIMDSPWLKERLVVR